MANVLVNYFIFHQYDGERDSISGCQPACLPSQPKKLWLLIETIREGNKALDDQLSSCAVLSIMLVGFSLDHSLKASSLKASSLSKDIR